jgi:glucose-6-phosphate isomerase/transaldolase/glucose-6-phosphate isomerase
VRDGQLTVKARLPDAMAALVASELQRAGAEQVERRVREGEPTLWAPAGTPEVADRLGWLTIARRMSSELPGLDAMREELLAEGVHDVVVLGMGGSSLAPEVLRRTFGRLGNATPEQIAAPTLHVLDSTDAAAVRALRRAVDPERTLFLVSSKSGGTIEPLSMFAHFWELVPRGDRFAAITDPGSGLERLADEHGFRRVFHGDPDIGGRYSALSPFGIVPAALSGADAGALLAGAQAAWQTPVSWEGRDEAPAGPPAPTGPPAWLWLGVALSALAAAGRDKLTIVTSDSLDGLGLWLEQLFAESTGKHGKGVLPVAQEPLLAPRHYGEDRVFLAIGDPSSPDPDGEAALDALAAAGHPLIRIPTQGPRDLGRVFMLAELCVAVAGWGLGINPFDQPNVQEAKDATGAVLKQIDAGQPPVPMADASADQLAELLLGASPPSYVALMGYMQPSDGVDAAIAKLRARIMAATKMTTTFGYGPRFLHSTGQFHKGGPPTGRFLQLLHDGGPDVPIPGKAYTFTTLKHAQADGDLQTLRAHHLPAARIALQGEDPVAGLQELGEQIDRIASQAGRQVTTTGEVS